jgi:DNA-directed RNA polymerase subunit RPC12/RpoP
MTLIPTMRVRPLRPTDRRSPARAERRPYVIGCPPEPETADVAVADHAAERRHRECVTCEDHALYSCSCGFQFTAPVSTSVACPHCGTAQAW